jgi:hypothetical protein
MGFKTNLDYQQVIRNSHDEPNQAVRTIDVGGLLAGVVYDYVSVNYATSTQEVYTYKTGGASGTTTATITLNYTDTTKQSLSNASKT